MQIQQRDPPSGDIAEPERVLSDPALNLAPSSSVQRSIALKYVIDSIVEATKNRMERVGKMNNVRAAIRVDDHELKIIHERCYNMKAKCELTIGQLVEREACLVEKLWQVKITKSKPIVSHAHKRCQELIDAGEPDDYAQWQAYEGVFSPANEEVVTLRREVMVCEEEIQRCQADKADSSMALACHQTMISLLEFVDRERTLALAVSPYHGFMIVHGA